VSTPAAARGGRLDRSREGRAARWVSAFGRCGLRARSHFASRFVAAREVETSGVSRRRSLKHSGTRAGRLDPRRNLAIELVVLYRKAALAGVGVGLLLAIAVATIDNIRLAQLASSLPSCPAPRCTRLTEIVSAEPLHVLLAFAVGLVTALAWFLRPRRARNV
jgi:hypothetical protein